MLVLCPAIAHADDDDAKNGVFFAYFRGQPVANVSFGDTCDSMSGDSVSRDVPNNQFQMHFNGGARPGGLYIHDVLVTVGNLGSYAFDAPAGVRIYGSAIGAKKSDPLLAVDGYTGTLRPNQSHRFIVDRSFQNPALEFQLAIGGNLGSCHITQILVKP